LDWDDLAWRTTGAEGAERYVRLGLILVVLSVVSLAAIAFLPIYSSDEASLRYDEMSEEPDEMPYGVPNSHALGHARWVLVGSFLLVLMGLVLVLEGKRVINLRRALAWHAEARATALFSLATLLAGIALLAGASLLSLPTSMPVATGEGVTVNVEATSPAALVVVTTMGLATAGMLAMSYYTCVLSVHRGGVTPRTRRMARFTFLLAVSALVALVVLRLGTIMTAVLEVAAGPDVVFKTYFPYTISRIDYQATLGADEAIKRTLDWQLTITSWLLFASYICGLAGLVGTSAHSLGGTSIRVRRAASMASLAAPMSMLGVLLMAWASVTAPDAAQQSWGIEDLEVHLGYGLTAGVVLCIAVLIASLVYTRYLGFGFAREALMFWRKPEVPPGDAEEEGIPQPLVDQVLARQAQVAGSLPPPVAMPPPVSALDRLLPTRARRVQLVVAVLVVVLIIVLAVWRPAGPGGPDGNGGGEDVVVGELPGFSWSFTVDDFLAEGANLNVDAFSDIDMDMETTVIFINEASVTLTWTDEPDANPLFTNQPDGFTVSIGDNNALDSDQDSGANPRNGQGTLSVSWSSGDAWLVLGNPELVDWGDAYVIQGVLLTARADMDSAGDQEARLRTISDPGNDFTMQVSVSGTHYIAS